MFVAPLLVKFMDQYPDLTLDLRFSDMQFDLIEGSYDLALRNAPLIDTSLKGRKLADDERILCAAPSYLQKHGMPGTPSELKSHKLISFRHSGARPLKDPQGVQATFDPNTSNSRLIIDDGLSQKQATLAGAGISLNSLWSVHAELKSGQLERVLPDHVGAEDNVLWLIYPKSNVLSPKVRVFMDFLIAELGRQPPWQR